MHHQPTRMLLLALVVMGLAAAPALANRWGGPRPCDVPGFGAQDKLSEAPNLTSEQKAAVQAVEVKYQPQFENLRSKMEAQRTAMQQAMANDKATLGELEAIRTQMFDLHQAVQKLRFTLQQDLRRAGVATAGFGPGEGFGHHPMQRDRRGPGCEPCPNSSSPAVEG